jgi:hypothetical protein
MDRNKLGLSVWTVLPGRACVRIFNAKFTVFGNAFAHGMRNEMQFSISSASLACSRFFLFLCKKSEIALPYENERTMKDALRPIHC